MISFCESSSSIPSRRCDTWSWMYAFLMRRARSHAGSCHIAEQKFRTEQERVHLTRADFSCRTKLTSETNHENPNLARSNKCSSKRMAARPGSIFHRPASSYKHTNNAQLVTIATTPRFCAQRILVLDLSPGYEILIFLKIQ